MTELADRIILARRNDYRILSLFIITNKLDNPDIVRITGLSNIRVSDALGDLGIYQVIAEGTSENPRFTKKTRKYYYLIESERERVLSLLHHTMKQEQFLKDKETIESLIAKGQIQSFFK